MNRNQVKGAAKQLIGKAQEKFGKATGRTKHQVKGAARKVEGKIQRNIGNAQQDTKRMRSHSS